MAAVRGFPSIEAFVATEAAADVVLLEGPATHTERYFAVPASSLATLCPVLAACATTDDAAGSVAVVEMCLIDVGDVQPDERTALIRTLATWIVGNTAVAAQVGAEIDVVAHAPPVCGGLSRAQLVEVTLAQFANGEWNAKFFVDSVFSEVRHTDGAAATGRQRAADADKGAVKRLLQLYRLSVVANARLLRAQVCSLLAALVREASVATPDPTRIVASWAPPADQSQSLEQTVAWLQRTVAGLKVRDVAGEEPAAVDDPDSP
jgi:hypothetical protein